MPTAVATRIKIGDVASDFTLPDDAQQPVKLSDFLGKKNVVLAFFPFAFSPVCTTENTCLTQDLPQFESADTVVLGISVDSVWAQKAWKDKLGLKHRLLSDVKKEVCQKYGLYREDIGCAERSTVIVDKKGIVRFVGVQEIKIARNDQEILTALKRLGA